MNTEQWKYGGNYKDCRRQEYCKQKCAAWKKRQDKIINDVAASLFTRTIDGKYGRLK